MTQSLRTALIFFYVLLLQTAVSAQPADSTLDDGLKLLEEARTTLEETALSRAQEYFGKLTQQHPENAVYFYELARVESYRSSASSMRNDKKTAEHALDEAMASVVTRVEATYQVPFLAHATMEPMNCTVHVRKDGCEVWVGSQVLARAQAAAAKTAGLPLDKVVVHNHLIGGGFGRRLEVDGVIRAVQIAQHVDAPVKVVWTREEDIQHDMYRPYFLDRISAGLDEKGMPVAWNHRFAGSSIMARWAPPFFNNGLDPDTTEGAIDLVYALPNMHVEYLRVEPPGIPTAFWRSVGPSHNVFVTESFIDELAAAAKQDAVAYRRALLDKSPRAKAVLDLAAEKADWGQPLPQGVGRGVSAKAARHAWRISRGNSEVRSTVVENLVTAAKSGA